jgi:hypothetical protein
MLIGDHHPPGDDSPSRSACIALSLAVTLQQRGFDITAGEAELLRLIERVERPTDGDRVDGHTLAG